MATPYGGVENCNAIRDSGRKPIIDPKSNAAPHGFNAKSAMLRFRDEHPGTFYGILRTRNNVKEHLFFDEGEVRWSGLSPQDAHPLHQAAVDVHLPSYVNMTTWPSREGRGAEATTVPACERCCARVSGNGQKLQPAAVGCGWKRLPTQIRTRFGADGCIFAGQTVSNLD